MTDRGPMDGKLAVVTGASSGIGEIAARELARLGADVVLVARSRERGEAARARIAAAVPGAAPELRLADLSVMDQVRELARDVAAAHPRVDVLLNNAGLVVAGRQETVDGLELTFATNHLATFLLTTALLTALEAAPSARVVVVSSDAHRAGRLNLDDLQSTRGYSAFRVYGTSKLCNILFARELARRTTVAANALHPGFVRTRFGHNTGTAGSLVAKVAQRLAAISPERGARTSIYLASSPEVEGVTGEYFTNMAVARSSAAARDDDAARRLWLASEELVGVATR